jgi:hypothetical protein
MDNEIIIIKNYSLRQYHEEARRNQTESLPASVSADDSDSTSSSAKGSALPGEFLSSDRLLDRVRTDGGDEFDLGPRSVSVCSFGSFAEPEGYDPMPRLFQADHWPEHLRICCAYCSLPVIKPWPLATGEESGRGARGFRVHSVYCCPAHIRNALQSWPRETYHEVLQATLMVVSQMARQRVPDLPLGLDKMRLARFCGAGGMRDADYLHENQRLWEAFLQRLDA